VITKEADKKQYMKAAEDHGERTASTEPVLGEGSRHRAGLTDFWRSL
jgi:hypothetical protein